MCTIMVSGNKVLKLKICVQVKNLEGGNLVYLSNGPVEIFTKI